MSSPQKIWTDGEAHTTVEHNRVATIASQADDRALDVLLTPHGTQKRVIPLSEESKALNPRLLIVPGTPNGTVRMLPAKLVAGGASAPHHISISITKEASIDSPLVGANSSGAARFDLLYATVAFGISAVGTRKVKDVQSGIIAPQPLNLEKAPVVQLGIIPRVSQGNPLGSLPADAADGSAFTFGLAVLAIPNGFTQGTVVTQAAITQLWSGGGVPFHRVRRYRPASLFDVPVDSTDGVPPLSERWGFGQRVAVAFRHLPSTGRLLVDAKMNWTGRVITVTMARAPWETDSFRPAHRVNAGGGDSSTGTGFTGSDGGTAVTCSFGGGPNGSPAKTFLWSVDQATGALFVSSLSPPANATAGDHYFVLVDATDQFEF